MRILIMGQNYETIMANTVRILLESQNVKDMVINESKIQKEKSMKWHIKILRGVDIFFCRHLSPDLNYNLP